MNINIELFKAITNELNMVLDTVPDHPHTKIREYEYYAMECCSASLMSYYKCPDQSQKSAEKLLTAVFDAGVFVGMFYDVSEDFEERQNNISDFLGHYDIWSDGRLDKFLKDDLRNDMDITRKLVIGESLALARNYGVVIEDNGALRDMITLLVAVFIFASRIKVKF